MRTVQGRAALSVLYVRIESNLVGGAGPDNLAGHDEVGGRSSVHPLLPLINPGHLADLLLPNVPDDLALAIHQAQQEQEASVQPVKRGHWVHAVHLRFASMQNVQQYRQAGVEVYNLRGSLST